MRLAHSTSTPYPCFTRLHSTQEHFHPLAFRPLAQPKFSIAADTLTSLCEAKKDIRNKRTSNGGQPLASKSPETRTPKRSTARIGRKNSSPTISETLRDPGKSFPDLCSAEDFAYQSSRNGSQKGHYSGDNESAQKLVTNPVCHEQTKYIEIKHHFVREKVLEISDGGVCRARTTRFSSFHSVNFGDKGGKTAYFPSAEKAQVLRSLEEMSVQEYLDKHMLARKIEDAVNAAVRAKTTDPMLFISNHMTKAVPSAITKIKQDRFWIVEVYDIVVLYMV
ncbi:Cytosolic enolase 3 [Platanthera zijinensis]|uniref:Cytosolic enolase 3 n=1 Tax=Platanthera zijinensis TaxID=2320716 RepID=A0AAP0BGY3_9ASPA